MRARNKSFTVWNIVRFHLAYVTQRVTFYVMLAALLVAAILTFVFVLLEDPSTNIIVKSLLIYLPIMAANIIVPSFLAWFLFSKSQNDKTQLLFIARDISRRINFRIKFSIIFIIGFLFCIVLNLTLAIVEVAFDVSSIEFLPSFFLSLIAGIVQVALFSAFAIAIAIVFKYVASIIVTMVAGAALIVAPVLAPLTLSAQSSNVLSYNGARNQTNYLAIERVDPSGHLQEEQLARYRASETRPDNAAFNGDWNINPQPGVGVVLDTLVTTPYSSLLGFALSPTTKIKAASSFNYADSLFTLKDEAASGEVTSSSPRIELLYGLNDLNPLTISYQEMLGVIADYYQNNNLRKAGIDVAYFDVYLTEFVDRVGRVAIWKEDAVFIQNIARYRNTLRFALGINKVIDNSALIFYLFRDWPVLGRNFPNLFPDLVARGMSTSLARSIDYLVTTNPMVVSNTPTADNLLIRQNVLEDDFVISHTEIADLYPFFPTYSDTKKATVINITQVKNLITTFNLIESGDPVVNSSVLPSTSPGTQVPFSTGTITLLLNGPSGVRREKLPILGFPYFGGAPNLQLWRELIDANSTYAGLKNVYANVNAWVKAYNSSYELAPITFQMNDFVPPAVERIEVNYASDIIKLSVSWAVIGVLIVGVLTFARIAYERRKLN